MVSKLCGGLAGKLIFTLRRSPREQWILGSDVDLLFAETRLNSCVQLLYTPGVFRFTCRRRAVFLLDDDNKLPHELTRDVVVPPMIFSGRTTTTNQSSVRDY